MKKSLLFFILWLPALLLAKTNDLSALSIGDELEETIDNVVYHFIITDSEHKYCAIQRISLSDGKDFFEEVVGNVRIPESFNGFTVREIRERAFHNLMISSVTIPETVEIIGEEAFGGYLPYYVKSLISDPKDISDYALGRGDGTWLYVPIGTKEKYQAAQGWNRAMICEVENPADMQEGDYAKTMVDGVEWSYQITSVTKRTCQLGYRHLPLGDKAAKPLSKVMTIPAELDGYRVTSTGSGTFQGSDIEKIVLPGSLEDIGECSFEHCQQLKDFQIPQGLKTISIGALRGCVNLTEIKIPSSVEKIDWEAFAWSPISSIYMEGKTPPTANEPFSSYDALLHVPRGCKEIYQSAPYWGNFTNIVEFPEFIRFENDEVKAICIDKWDFNGDGELDVDEAALVLSLDGAFRENKTITSFNELEFFTNLQAIGNYEFFGCSSLRSVVVPRAISSLGVYCFGDCLSLTELQLPSYLKEIPKGCCAGCTNLQRVTFGVGRYWEPQANWGCSDPNGIIRNHAFDNCCSLKELHVLDLAVPLFDNGYIEENQGTKAFENVDLGQIAVYIPMEASKAYQSEWCNWLQYGFQNFIEEESLESVSFMARGFTFLKHKEDDSKVSIISSPSWCSTSCAGDVVIPEGVEYAGRTYTVDGIRGSGLFTSVTSITLPKTIEYIGPRDEMDASMGLHPFYSCTKLANIFVDESNNNYFSHQGALYDKIEKKLLQFPICAIDNDTVITHYEIPDGIKEIADHALSFNLYLRDLVIPESVELIGRNAILSTNSLENIWCYATTPPGRPTLVDGVINTVYIPYNCKNAYLAEDDDFYPSSWAQVKNLVEMPPTIKIDMTEGWNWISTNLESEDMRHCKSFFEDRISIVLRIVGQTQELVFDPEYGWIGNLYTLSPSAGYKVQMAAESMVSKTGRTEAANSPITLQRGWNWLGYLPVDALPIGTALSGLAASEGDRIVCQDGFAEYNGGTWVSSFEAMEPGKGYMYQAKKDVTFSYPSAAASRAAASPRAALHTPAVGPWSYDSHLYPDVVTVIATVTATGGSEGRAETEASPYVVGAFCGEECRGIGRGVGDKLFVTVHGTCGSGETITFRAYDAAAGEVQTVAEHITFLGQSLGSAAAPMVLHVEEPTGISTPRQAEANGHYYAPNGQRLEQPRRGVNIIVGRDGGTRKVLVK